MASAWSVGRHAPLPVQPRATLRRPEARGPRRGNGPPWQSSRGREVLDAGDQLWLNRHLLEAAFRQATGHACFRRLNSGLDGVLVSDVGKRIDVQGSQRAGGLIRTALRATDILMDRVWQLETETFHDTPGFVFAPITEVVEPAEDPTALHPEIQRQAANIRTDLDRFSPLEISTLVRHGYCVCRKSCRCAPTCLAATCRPTPPGTRFPAPRQPPLPRPRTRMHRRGAGGGDGRGPDLAIIRFAPHLEHLAGPPGLGFLHLRAAPRSTPLPAALPRDPLLPAVSSAQPADRFPFPGQSGSGEDEPAARRQSDPMERRGGGEVCRILDEPDLKGFEILQDSRMIDLRDWNPDSPGKSDPTSLAYVYRRLKVVKQRENTTNHLFRVRLLPTSSQTAVRFPTQQLRPRLRISELERHGCRPGRSVAGKWTMIFTAFPPENSSISSWKSTLGGVVPGRGPRYDLAFIPRPGRDGRTDHVDPDAQGEGVLELQDRPAREGTSRRRWKPCGLSPNTWPRISRSWRSSCCHWMPGIATKLAGLTGKHYMIQISVSN